MTPKDADKDQPVSAAQETIAAQDAARATEDAIRDEAQAIKGQFAGGSRGWDGLMNRELYGLLEPLLYRPTPLVYVEYTPARTNKDSPGLPYPATGVRSTQFQVDRMNNVLGQPSWRWMMHYQQAGNLARAVVVVGNDLHLCKLDGEGELVWWQTVDGVVSKADIITVRDGWGGHNMRQPGDTFKAGETSTLKRVVARFGPGADVFRIDYDGDIIDALSGQQPTVAFDRSATGSAVAAHVPEQRAQKPAAKAAPLAISEKEAEEKLSALLEQDTGESEVAGIEGPVNLKDERLKALNAMRNLPPNLRPSIVQEWNFLSDRKDDVRQLRDLVTRAENAGGAG